MGIFDNIAKVKIGRGPQGRVAGAPASTPNTTTPGSGSSTTRDSASPSAATPQRSRPESAVTTKPGSRRSKVAGKRRRKGSGTSPRERIATAAAPLHDRRRRLVGARETTLRDLGGLMLEMYKRNRFREELLLDKCEEVLAVEVEIAHVDQRLFQLAPTNAAGMRPIGRCECDAPIYPGQNFCGVCGRSFATLTQARACARCGAGLRRGDQYCSTCGAEAPDMLQVIEPPSGRPHSGAAPIDASSIASSAVAETVIIDTPSLVTEEPASTADVPPPPADPVSASPELDVARASSSARETGFSWATPPEALPDAAIDAALESLPPQVPNPSNPFGGVPFTATAPPSVPIVDSPDVDAPPPPMSSSVVELASTPPARTAPTARLTGDDASDAAAKASADAEAKAAKAAAKADAKAAKAAANAEAKALAATRKQQAKDARTRAKDRAKAARIARKRGGDGA